MLRFDILTGGSVGLTSPAKAGAGNYDSSTIAAIATVTRRPLKQPLLLIQLDLPYQGPHTFERQLRLQFL